MLRRFSYTLLGMAVASGAPLGLLGLRMGRCHARPTRDSVRAEVCSDPAAYLYVALGTSIAFTLFGFLLGRQVDRLKILSLEDPLTRLPNRRGFCRRLDEELSRSKRYRQPVALLLIDVDRLKRINDRKGHRTGDSVLQHVAQAIRAELRSTDMGARWGGDEFAVLAPNTSEAAALTLGERIRTVISAAAEHGHVTASIGVAVFDTAHFPADISASDVIGAADEALYAAKRHGRNRVASSPRFL